LTEEVKSLRRETLSAGAHAQEKAQACVELDEVQIGSLIEESRRHSELIKGITNTIDGFAEEFDPPRFGQITIDMGGLLSGPVKLAETVMSQLIAISFIPSVVAAVLFFISLMTATEEVPLMELSVQLAGYVVTWLFVLWVIARYFLKRKRKN
jgi:hypothetical protein